MAWFLIGCNLFTWSVCYSLLESRDASSGMIYDIATNRRRTNTTISHTLMASVHWTRKAENKLTAPNVFIDYRISFCRAASVSASSVQAIKHESSMCHTDWWRWSHRKSSLRFIEDCTHYSFGITCSACQNTW